MPAMVQLASLIGDVSHSQPWSIRDTVPNYSRRQKDFDNGNENHNAAS